MIEQRDFMCPMTKAQCEDPRCSEEDCVQEPDRMSSEYRAESRQNWQALLDRLGL